MDSGDGVLVEVDRLLEERQKAFDLEFRRHWPPRPEKARHEPKDVEKHKRLALELWRGLRLKGTCDDWYDEQEP